MSEKKDCIENIKKRPVGRPKGIGNFIYLVQHKGESTKYKTIKEVADYLKVSKHTISRIINGKLTYKRKPELKLIQITKVKRCFMT